MKKFFLFFSLFISLIFISSFLNVALAQQTFSDIANHKYESAIEFLADKDIVHGNPDGTFKADELVNRAEVIKMVLEREVPIEFIAEDCFSDVLTKDWFSQYVCSGKRAGIIQGYSDGKFRPEQTVTFAEALKMAMVSYWYTYQPGETVWFEKIVRQASDMNIIPLDIIDFNQPVTRGQVADMLARLIYYEDGELDVYLGPLKDQRVKYEDAQNKGFIEADFALTDAGSYVFSCDSAIAINVPADTDYLIVSRPLFADAILPFITKKEQEGYRVTYVNLDDVLCDDFEGRDVPERLRNFLKQIKETTQLKYLLLLGNPLHSIYPSDHSPVALSVDWEMPIRYVEGISAPGETPIVDIPTDQYYASLDYTWDDNDNNIFGEYLEDLGVFEFSMKPDIYVGRVPVKTAEDLSNWVSKTIEWEVPNNPSHTEFISARCVDKKYWTDENGSPITHIGMEKTHRMKLRYCTEDQGGDIADFANLDNPDYVSTYSHGDYYGVTRWPNEYGYDLYEDSPGFDKPPVLFVHGCNVGALDFPQESLGQQLIAAADGITAMVASTRSHWDIRFRLWEEVFYHHNYQLSEAAYEYKYRRFNIASLDNNEMKNLFMFNVYGDPALKLVEPDIEMFTAETFDFEGQEIRELEFNIANHTDEDITGFLREQLNNGFTDRCNLFDKEASECEIPFTIPANSSQVVSQDFLLTRIPIDAGDFTNFVFDIDSDKHSVTGAASLLKYNKYTLSCSRVIKNGDDWRAYTKAVGVEEDREDDVRVFVRAGGYYDLDTLYAAGEVPQELVLETKVNFFLDSAPVFTVQEISERDDRATDPDVKEISPMVSIITYSDGNIAGECEAFIDIEE